MVHSRVLIQSGDWRKYAEGICCQENNYLRNSAYAWNLRIVNVSNRVAYSCVLCDGVIIIIRNSCLRVDHYILHLAAETDCAVDLRLVLRIQIDTFCVAASLEVEYAIVTPSMLIVSDQLSCRICRQSCLSCSGKAEEDSRLMSLRIHICGAVHWKHIFLNRH